jgi:hypothetical protein
MGDITDDLELKTDVAFEQALGEIIESAVENGVSIEGGWTTDTDFDSASWDIHITRVERDS